MTPFALTYARACASDANMRLIIFLCGALALWAGIYAVAQVLNARWKR